MCCVSIYIAPCLNTPIYQDIRRVCWSAETLGEPKTLPTWDFAAIVESITSAGGPQHKFELPPKLLTHTQVNKANITWATQTTTILTSDLQVDEETDRRMCVDLYTKWWKSPKNIHRCITILEEFINIIYLTLVTAGVLEFDGWYLQRPVAWISPRNS